MFKKSGGVSDGASGGSVGGGNSEGEKNNPPEGESKVKQKMKTVSQLEILEKTCAMEMYPSEATRAKLSVQFRLSDRQLHMWFCHRRLKYRKVPPLKQQRKDSTLPGSVNGANYKELAAKPDVDGFLVGGTSLKEIQRGCTGDACCVMRLRSCGAIIVGETNMHELGTGLSGINPCYRTNRNSYDPNKITGGSSNGSAAIVSARLCPVALGVDGGGSVWMPASLCGVVGFKLTFGCIPHLGGDGCFMGIWLFLLKVLKTPMKLLDSTRCGFPRASMMSLVHPLSTGSASKFYKCFDGELHFPCSWLFRVLCQVKSKSG
ncbi:hypothetical protein CRYUN_Cryun37aG0098400 [Craigia yunnanensis]